MDQETITRIKELMLRCAALEGKVDKLEQRMAGADTCLGSIAAPLLTHEWVYQDEGDLFRCVLCNTLRRM